MNFTYWAPLAGVVALIFALFLVKRIDKVEPGNAKMQDIANAIREGAMAFLKREYKALVVFVLIVAVIIAILGLVTSGES